MSQPAYPRNQEGSDRLKHQNDWDEWPKLKTMIRIVDHTSEWPSEIPNTHGRITSCVSEIRRSVMRYRIHKDAHEGVEN